MKTATRPPTIISVLPVGGLISSAAITDSAEVPTLENSSGKWWANGPVRRIWSGEGLEADAIDDVAGANHMQYGHAGTWRECSRHDEFRLAIHDSSTGTVRDNASC